MFVSRRIGSLLIPRQVIFYLDQFWIDWCLVQQTCLEKISEFKYRDKSFFVQLEFGLVDVWSNKFVFKRKVTLVENDRLDVWSNKFAFNRKVTVVENSRLRFNLIKFDLGHFQFWVHDRQ